jgi:hypothetical protein
MQVRPVHRVVGVPVLRDRFRAQVEQLPGLARVPEPHLLAGRHAGPLAQRLRHAQQAKMRVALALSCRPAPTSPSSRACSNTCTSWPRRINASAAVRPPSPAPAIRIFCFMVISAAAPVVRARARDLPDHFAKSALMTLAEFAALGTPGSTPWRRARGALSGDCAALAKACDSFCTTGAACSLGRHQPEPRIGLVAVDRGRLHERHLRQRRVGLRAGHRVGLELAALDVRRERGGVSNTRSICPPSASVMAGLPPRYGTCVSCTCARSFRYSVARWPMEPLPALPTVRGCSFANFSSSGSVLGAGPGGPPASAGRAAPCRSE